VPEKRQIQGLFTRHAKSVRSVPDVRQPRSHASDGDLYREDLSEELKRDQSSDTVMHANLTPEYRAAEAAFRRVAISIRR